MVLDQAAQDAKAAAKTERERLQKARARANKKSKIPNKPNLNQEEKKKN